jgi:hypothetical protein
MNSDYLLLLLLYLAGLCIRHAYEQLKKSGKIDLRTKSSLP